MIIFPKIIINAVEIEKEFEFKYVTYQKFDIMLDNNDTNGNENNDWKIFLYVTRLYISDGINVAYSWEPYDSVDDGFVFDEINTDVIYM